MESHSSTRVVLGERKFKEAHAAWREDKVGNKAAPINLEKLRQELTERLKRDATKDDLYSHLMYPQVFADFAKGQREFSDVSVLPTPAFYYGLKLMARRSAAIMPLQFGSRFSSCDGWSCKG